MKRSVLIVGKNRRYLLSSLFIGILLILIYVILAPKNSAYLPDDKEKVSLHPYIGYTMNPDINKRVNTLGFDGQLISKGKDEYAVGIFGGSIAYLYTYAESQNLIRELKKIPSLQDKNIVVYNFALPGYKQPQQLMTLTYLLALGYKLNLIINIDGFNEAALSYVTNYKNGVSSFYPWNWYLNSQRTLNRDILNEIKNIESIKKLQAFSLMIPWHLGSWLYDATLKINRYRQIELTRKLEEVAKSYQTKGPEPYMKQSDNHEVEEILSNWQNSALQMDMLAKMNNIVYLEFLHPNQYVPNSKPFTLIEKQKYINWNHPYAIAAKNIYPRIIAKTQYLKENGIAIYDLTQVFSQSYETLYLDDCCHYIKKGYSLLTSPIVEATQLQLGTK